MVSSQKQMQSVMQRERPSISSLQSSGSAGAGDTVSISPYPVACCRFKQPYSPGHLYFTSYTRNKKLQQCKQALQKVLVIEKQSPKNKKQTKNTKTPKQRNQQESCCNRLPSLDAWKQKYFGTNCRQVFILWILNALIASYFGQNLDSVSPLFFFWTPLQWTSL